MRLTECCRRCSSAVHSTKQSAPAKRAAIAPLTAWRPHDLGLGWKLPPGSADKNAQIGAAEFRPPRSGGTKMGYRQRFAAKTMLCAIARIRTRPGCRGAEAVGQIALRSSVRRETPIRAADPLVEPCAHHAMPRAREPPFRPIRRSKVRVGSRRACVVARFVGACYSCPDGLVAQDRRHASRSKNASRSPAVARDELGRVRRRPPSGRGGGNAPRPAVEEALAFTVTPFRAAGLARRDQAGRRGCSRTARGGTGGGLSARGAAQATRKRVGLYVGFGASTILARRPANQRARSECRTIS